MQIDRNAWHCKVYLWWYYNKYPSRNPELKREVGEWYTLPEEKTQSNLCPYMRVVLLWAPVRAVLWHWITIGKVPINAITIPAVIAAFPFLFNHTIQHRIWIAYLLALCLCTIIASIVGTLVFIGTHWKYVGSYLTPIAEKMEPKAVSFIKLLGEYFRSAHDRVCPEVTWDKQED